MKKSTNTETPETKYYLQCQRGWLIEQLTDWIKKKDSHAKLVEISAMLNVAPEESEQYKVSACGTRLFDRIGSFGTMKEYNELIELFTLIGILNT